MSQNESHKQSIWAGCWRAQLAQSPIKSPSRTSSVWVAALLLMVVATMPARSQPEQDEGSTQRAGAVALEAATALELYVRSPDPNYSFEIVDTIQGDGYRAYIVHMSSQAWLTESQVDRPVWWHWLTLVVPDRVDSSTALLYIGGGDNDDPQPKAAPGLLVPLAMGTNAVVAELRMVPNQPLIFAEDAFGPRKEDQIIAYGWDKFLRGGGRDADALWLARLPMTKSAVRAMDTIASVMSGEAVGAQRQHIDNFVVAGGSKRGWTTWTTAVVDDRVVAIVPLVIDMLNTVPSFEHHWQAYGFWSPAVGDYKREGIMEWQDREEYSQLLAITEPYSYRERLTLPKLMINASGDEFFLPDSWQFYWQELVGEKHLRYVPNTGHSLAGTDAGSSLGAFFKTVVDGTERPEVEWKVDGDTIEVSLDPEQAPPTAVKLWQAHNERTRDFRVVRIKETWTESTLAPVSPGKYSAQVKAPEHGWSAFFVEVTYPVGDFELKVTSGINVVPKTLPYAQYKVDRSVLPPE